MNYTFNIKNKILIITDRFPEKSNESSSKLGKGLFGPLNLIAYN